MEVLNYVKSYLKELDTLVIISKLKVSIPKDLECLIFVDLLLIAFSLKLRFALDNFYTIL